MALERVALVPRAGDDPAGVVAALLDGMTYVVVGPTPGSQRPNAGNCSPERGSGPVAAGAREHAAVRLDVVAHRWAGTDAGDGFLRRCELAVARTARGITDRWTLTLATPGGPLVDPVVGRRNWRRRRGAGRCAWPAEGMEHFPSSPHDSQPHVPERGSVVKQVAQTAGLDCPVRVRLDDVVDGNGTVIHR